MSQLSAEAALVTGNDGDIAGLDPAVFNLFRIGRPPVVAPMAG